MPNVLGYYNIFGRSFFLKTFIGEICILTIKLYFNMWYFFDTLLDSKIEVVTKPQKTFATYNL